mgnify:FL=1
MRRLLPFIFFAFSLSNCYPQLLNNSLFRIYRAEFIHGAVTQLRFDNDSTYQMSIAEIHCSLCDHEMLDSLISSQGIWLQQYDTIYLQSQDREIIKMLFINDSLLKPLSPFGFNMEHLNDSTRNRIIERFNALPGEEFHLIYDTYPNGVARFIFDKFRMMRSEYEIELKSNGSVKAVRYYFEGKQSKRIR